MHRTMETVSTCYQRLNVENAPYCCAYLETAIISN
jgi:hypothetical protein